MQPAQHRQTAARRPGARERLHRAAEFTGTGIGLANVRHLISRHRGRTWAEARLNAGAPFYFTLRPAPASQPAVPAHSQS